MMGLRSVPFRRFLPPLPLAACATCLALLMAAFLMSVPFMSASLPFIRRERAGSRCGQTGFLVQGCDRRSGDRRSAAAGAHRTAGGGRLNGGAKARLAREGEREGGRGGCGDGAFRPSAARRAAVVTAGKTVGREGRWAVRLAAGRKVTGRAAGCATQVTGGRGATFRRNKAVETAERVPCSTAGGAGGCALGSGCAAGAQGSVCALRRRDDASAPAKRRQQVSKADPHAPATSASPSPPNRNRPPRGHLPSPLPLPLPHPPRPGLPLFRGLLESIIYQLRLHYHPPWPSLCCSIRPPMTCPHMR